MSTTNIILLHLLILASQALYMYLSNKARLKSNVYLYLIAIPIAAAFPVVLNMQDPQAYSLYEYSIVFCIVFAAMCDSVLAAVKDEEFLTDPTCRSLIYSYLTICAVTAFTGSTNLTVRLIAAFLLVGSVLAFCLAKKHSVMELVKSLPLTLISLLLSWAFLRFGL